MHFSQQMTLLLSTIDYPVHPDDLLREAARDGVPQHEIAELEQLPMRAYHGSRDVTRSLRWHNVFHRTS